MYIQQEFGKYGPYHGNDIAILRMAQPIQISNSIVPICLGTWDLPLGIQSSANISLTGFGHDKFKAHKLLRKTHKLNLITNVYCQEKWSSSNKTIFNSQICTEPTGDISILSLKTIPLFWSYGTSEKISELWDYFKIRNCETYFSDVCYRTWRIVRLYRGQWRTIVGVSGWHCLLARHRLMGTT
jgi:hypothetical protein